MAAKAEPATRSALTGLDKRSWQHLDECNQPISDQRWLHAGKRRGQKARVSAAIILAEQDTTG